MIRVKENYLDKNYFNKIKSEITSFYFPWFYQSKMTEDGYGWEKPYFSHIFYDKFFPNSKYYSLLVDCLNIMEIKSLIRVRANLSLDYNERYYSSWHVDQETPCKVAILYLNTNNGYTEIKDNEKILKVPCEENKMIIFDSYHLHRLVSQTNDQKRIAINFNFYAS